MQSSSLVVETVLRAVPRLPRPTQPPADQGEWWERGVLDGVETMKLFAQEALATIYTAAAGEDAVSLRLVVAELSALFSTSGPRRADGRLDEVWIQSTERVAEEGS